MKPTKAITQDYLTVKQAAKLLGINRASVQYLVAHGRLRSKTYGDGDKVALHLIRREDVLTYARHREQRAAKNLDAMTKARTALEA